jgi:hypothetical protein
MNNTPYLIKPDGTDYYLVDGAEVPARDFEKRHAVPFSLVVNNKLNFDTTKRWYNDN